MEASTTQHRLEKSFRQRKTTDNSARQFADLIFQGKIKQALEMLSKNGTGGILRLEDTISTKDTSRSVKETLKSPSEPAALDVCAQGNPPQVHPITYDAINATLVRSIALQARGACGPEAYDWRRLCTSFQSPSDTLCEALASSAKRLCSMHINHHVVSPLLASRLIANAQVSDLLALVTPPGASWPRPLRLSREKSKKLLDLNNCARGRSLESKPPFTQPGNAS